MAFQILTVGTLLALLIVSRSWKRWIRAIGVASIAAVTTLGLVELTSLSTLLGIELRGREQSTTATQALLFCALIVGIVAKYLWDAIDQRQERNAKRGPGEPKHPVEIDLWDLLKPLLVSAIVFQTVGSSQREISMAALTFSFQNGFFWQTVFEKKRASV